MSVGIAILFAAQVSAAADKTEPISAEGAGPESRIVVSALLPPSTDPAGVLSAGLACFPRGRLRVLDFVSSNAVFRDALIEAFSSSNLPSTPKTGDITVRLKFIDAKLCARGYGIYGTGDQRSLSGEAKFSFEWQYGSSGQIKRSGSTIIEMKLKKADALPVNAIFAEALTRLISEVYTGENNNIG